MKTAGNTVSETDLVDNPLWKYALVAALAALLTVAVMGLVTSIRQTRQSQPSQILHA